MRRLRLGASALAARLPLASVTLFGSYARGRQTAASDVDVLVVYDGEPRDDAYALAWHTLDLPRLELHVYTTAEAAGLRATLARMTADGVAVYPPAPSDPPGDARPPGGATPSPADGEEPGERAEREVPRS